ncbi:MAG: hypothetical protein SchgKO_04310 [Schleiferiaceae bacterium]
MRYCLFVIGILALAPSLWSQEWAPHYEGDLIYNDVDQTLSGTYRIDFTAPHDSTLAIPVELWTRAVTSSNSPLAQEWINNQSTTLYFAPKRELGSLSIQSLSLLINGEETEIDTLSDADLLSVILPQPISKGTAVTLNLRFTSHLPLRRYGGMGYDAEMVQLVHALPVLSSVDSVFKPMRANIRNHSMANEYSAHIQFQLPKGYQPEGPGSFEFSKANRGSKITWNQKGKGIPGFSLMRDLKYQNIQYTSSRGKVDIEWAQEGDLDFPVTQEGLGHIQEYLYQNGYPSLPKELKVRIVQEKYYLKNHPEILWVESTKQPHTAEVRLLRAWIEALWLNEYMINDHQHPWITQGFLQKAEDEYLAQFHSDQKLLGWAASTWVAKFFDVDQYDPSYKTKALHWYMARQGFSQPLSDSASTYPKLMYQSVVVGRGSEWLSTLQNIAGDTEFKRGMKRFTESNPRRPVPADILKNVDYYSNERLDWFLAEGYSTAGVIDYALTGNEHCSYVHTIDVKNKGDITLPVRISGVKDGKTVISEVFDSISDAKTVSFHVEDYDYLMLDREGVLPDINNKNNTTHTRKYFQGFEPLRLQFYTSFEDPHKTQIFWFPSLKFNAYDKFLPGIRIYNRTLIPKKFEYWLGPDYSIGTGKLTGVASLKYNHYSPTSWARLWSFGVYTRYYHYAPDLAYFRLSPALNIYFKKPYARSTLQRRLRLRYVHVDRELAPVLEPGISPLTLNNASYGVWNAQMTWDEVNIISPYKVLLDAQFSAEFSRLSAMVDKRWMLPNKRWLIWRSFAAGMLTAEHTGNGEDAYFAMGLSGTRDYLFDYYFIGRSDTKGLWSRQFFITDGGFKANTNTFGTNFMLTTGVNVPIWTVFGVFGDVGYVDNFDTMYWDYGVRISILTDFLEFYLPIQSSQRDFIYESDYLSNARMVLNVDVDQIIDRVRRGWY